MLSQQTGVSTLLPSAVDVLLCDPLAKGDYYAGDLLAAVLRLPDSVWASLKSERERLANVLAAVVVQADQFDKALLGEIKILLR
jgi:hypothetical protein